VVFVWTRESVGKLGEQIAYTVLLIIGAFRLKSYMLLKEQAKWTIDDPLDDQMDFYSAFIPVFVFIGLFIFKKVLIKGSNDIIRLGIAKSAIALAVVTETYFDS